MRFEDFASKNRIITFRRDNLDVKNWSGYVDTGLSTHAEKLRTMACFLKCDAASLACSKGHFREIIAKSKSCTGFELLLKDEHVQTYLMGGTGTTVNAINGPKLSPGEWTHLAATHNGPSSRLRLYVNGVLHQERAAPSVIADPGGNVKIGAWSGRVHCVVESCEEGAVWVSTKRQNHN